MTTAEYAEKVEASKQKIEKIKATIERHQKALAKLENKLLELQKQPPSDDLTREIYFAECDIKYKKEDIRANEAKLEESRRLLRDRERSYNKSLEEDRIVEQNTPQIIKDYLEKWKADAFDWYLRRYAAFQDFKEKLRTDEIEIRNKAIAECEEYARYRGREMSYHEYINMYPHRPVDEMLKEAKLDYSSVQKRKKEFAGAVVLKMCEQHSAPDREAWLKKYLEAEKREMILDLVSRLREHVGTITDATGLHMGYTGVEGLIIGDKGKAKLQSIGAGGYNVQCWHVRVLIHPVKDKESLADKISNAEGKASRDRANASSPVNEKTR